MDQIYEIYNQFIGYFPKGAQWAVSLCLAVLLVYAIYKIIKRHFVFLILLFVLLPASAPIFKHLWNNLLVFLKFLVSRK
jgi:hypothetical protein